MAAELIMQRGVNEIKQILDEELQECPIRYTISLSKREHEDFTNIESNGAVIKIVVVRPKDMVAIAHALYYAVQSQYGDRRVRTSLRTDGNGNPVDDACKLQLWSDSISTVVFVHISVQGKSNNGSLS